MLDGSGYIDITNTSTSASARQVFDQSISLECVVDGAENLNAYISYRWTKNNGTHTEILVEYRTSLILTFSPLSLSDAGHYTCNATIDSKYTYNAVSVSSQPFEIISE